MYKDRLMLLKMSILCLIIMACLAETIANSVSCGPQGLCSCISPDEIDCSSTNIRLADICKGIEHVTKGFQNAKLTKLRAEKNNYQEVKNKDLDGCKQLKSLYLATNNIAFIQTGTFYGLDNLQLLDLSFNKISYNHENFSTTKQFPSSLKTLKLNGNLIPTSLDYFGYPDFSYMTVLQELHIDGLFNGTFPLSYRKMTNLKTIVMTELQGSCNITQITNKTMNNLVHVRHLNLSACNIGNIYAGAFEELSELEVLDLSENRRLGLRMLKNISYGLQFTQIKSLNISKVQNTFGMSTMLSTGDICYLWNTSITEFVSNSNRIEMFETNLLILFSKSLQILRLEDNSFTFGPYLLQLGCLSQLTEYYGSYQNSFHNPYQFDVEPEEYTYELNIQDDGCPYMTNEFLRSISESNKYCRFFEPGEKISINDNLPMYPPKTKRVSFASSGMEYNISSFLIFPLNNSFEYLDFSGNILHAMTGPVGPFPNLKYVDLSKNYCSFVSANAFNGIINMENLQLQRNFIGLVFNDEIYGPHIFEKLVNLKTLNLSSNVISFIPQNAFSTMRALETIDLSYNSIEKLTLSVETLDNLLNLNLSTNFLQTLSKNLTSKLVSNSIRLNRSFSIDMRNNLVTVSCNEKEFLDWMVKHKRSFSFFEEYSFQDSSGLPISASVFVSKVNGLNKLCQSYTQELVFGSIGVSVFLAIIIGGFIYKNRWNIRYLMRLTKIRYFGYRRLGEYILDNEYYTYDGFISYANENLRFILDHIVPTLENSGFKLCLHDRDFIPGDNIADNIIGAIRKSKKTVIVLSEDFLKSEWCLFEFHMARMESIYSRAGSNCLLVVMYGDVSNRNMPNEMLEWIRSNTFLEFTTEEHGFQLFWDSLCEAIRE